MNDLSIRSLHHWSPTGRFSNLGEQYARYRPSYPQEALEAIVSGTEKGKTIVDIGAGTGISARALADLGYSIIAVEPNAGMRDAAEPHTHVRWVDATGENTGLPDHCCARVVYAQAFHWVEPEAAIAEAVRIVEPGGRLCAIWNEADPNCPVADEYKNATLACATNPEVAQVRTLSGQSILESRLLTDPTLQFFYQVQPMTLDELIGRAFSTTYAPTESEPQQRLVQRLTETFAKYKTTTDTVLFGYRVSLYSAASPHNIKK